MERQSDVSLPTSRGSADNANSIIALGNPAGDDQQPRQIAGAAQRETAPSSGKEGRNS
jgi:hypothetical protein